MTKAEEAGKRKEARMQEELERVRSMARFEQEAVKRAGGHGPVCGIDEAGRGPLAGPVAAAAVILPEDLVLPWLNDSKKVTPKRRLQLYDEIREKALAWAVVMVSPERIDEINILQATYEAMRSAVGRLPLRPGVLVNDAVTIPGIDILQVPVIKGDAKCASVAAASILAKVTRDAYMEKMDEQYPAYGFARHKGYGTKEHRDAIAANGPCPIHRRSFLGNILQEHTQAKIPGSAGGAFADRASVPTAGSAAEKAAASLADCSPSPVSALDRRALGSMEEEKAACFLMQKGVRILERNFGDRNGEIDIIGEQDGILLFIEVKYRKDAAFGSPSEAVTPRKQESISRTALYYLRLHDALQQQAVRFDVIAITDRSIQWIKDAFPFSGK